MGRREAAPRTVPTPNGFCVVTTVRDGNWLELHRRGLDGLNASPKSRWASAAARASREKVQLTFGAESETRSSWYSLSTAPSFLSSLLSVIAWIRARVM